jgi:hypothetical protein
MASDNTTSRALALPAELTLDPDNPARNLAIVTQALEQAVASIHPGLFAKDPELVPVIRANALLVGRIAGDLANKALLAEMK